MEMSKHGQLQTVLNEKTKWKKNMQNSAVYCIGIYTRRKSTKTHGNINI